MTIYIEGVAVSVKGGAYGTALVPVGQLSDLIAQITAENTPAAPIYDLKISGTGEVIALSTSIRQTVDIKKNGVELPDSSDTSLLAAFVRTSFAGTLPKIDSISISSIVNMLL